MDVETAIRELELMNKVSKDDLVPDLLVLPSGTDLHDHPLVASGSVFLQGKASSMVAAALCPQPGWQEEIDLTFEFSTLAFVDNSNSDTRQIRKKRKWKKNCRCSNHAPNKA